MESALPHPSCVALGKLLPTPPHPPSLSLTHILSSGSVHGSNPVLGEIREASSPSSSLNTWDPPSSAPPSPLAPCTHHAQVAQQPVAPRWLREAAQPAADDIEAPAELQEPQQQAEENEEQGEEERRAGIQAEGSLLQAQEVQQVFCQGQHPEETQGMGVNAGGNPPPAARVPYIQ